MAEAQFFDVTGSNGASLKLMRDADAYKKVLDMMTSAELEHLQKRKEAHQKAAAEVSKIDDEIKKLKARNYDDESAEVLDLLEKKKTAAEKEKKLRKEVTQAEITLEDAANAKKEKAEEVHRRKQQAAYMQMSAAEKLRYNADVESKLKIQKEALQLELSEAKKAEEEKTAFLEKKQEKLKQARRDGDSQRIAQFEKEVEDATRELEEASSRTGTITEKIADTNTGIKGAQKRQGLLANLGPGAIAEQKRVIAEQAKSLALSRQEAKLKRAEAERAIASSDKVKAAQAKLDAIKKKGSAEEIKAAQDELENEIKNHEAYKDLKAAEAELEENAHEKRKLSLKELAVSTAETALKIGAKVGASIENNLSVLYGSQGRMQARLQSSTEDWIDALGVVDKAIGLSGIVSKRSVVEKMAQLVDSGVAYNIELRSFIASAAENIASTFEAFDGSLLRMIRLQQQDSTAARLGLEATLTKLFNSYFQDTSYLSGTSDTVSQTILDASASRGTKDSVEFEFNVQKWLGALYSVGASETAVQKIAEGINYLGTGNVTALAGDNALQTLFAMSAAKSGKSYSALLQAGLSGDDTNDLLKSMVEYLADIANSQTNNVTKAAYAELFGMSITDLSTFASLTTKELQNLHSANVSYDQLVNETVNQLNSISSRLSLSQMVDNVISNAELGAAELIGSNAFTYGMWKALSVLKDYVGEVKIPSVLAAGFGLSSDIDLINVAQTGLAGIGLLSSLIEGIGSMHAGGPTNLSLWGAEDSTSRGGGLSVLNTGISTNTSYSAVLGTGSTSASDVTAVSLQSAQDSATSTSSEEAQAAQEIPQKIYDALAGDDSPNILSLLQEIDDRLDPARVFYTAIAGVMSTQSVSNLTNLSSQITAHQASAQSINTSTIQTNNQTTGAVGITGTQQAGGGTVSTPQNAVTDISEVIAEAVKAALGSYAFSGSPIPVSVVTSGGTI